MTLASTPEARFDIKLRGLLGEARALVRVFRDTFSQAFPTGIVPGDQFPAATVNRLMIAASPLYEAGVSCLAEAETSLGAHALLRTLIEAWSHLDFIRWGDPGDSAECAIRVDLGIAELVVDLVATAATPLATPDELTKAEKRRGAVQAIHNQHGCAGPARTYRQVLPTVRAMAERPGLDWLIDSYKAASMTIHATSYDWSIQPGPRGAATVVTPRPSHRAARLNHLVVTYTSLAQTALVLAGIGPLGAELDAATQHLLADAFLQRAIARDYD